jgi:AcrR family transcriptional regulator
MQDARGELFEAAKRVLLRDGPSGLTSRSVTEEAGCAKGVLHRHFTDFDGFLCELVLSCADQLEADAETLRASVGHGLVAENLTRALAALLGPVPVAIVPLITFHDKLRARLRRAKPGGGIAILGEVTSAISAYLVAERQLGRIRADADLDALTLALVGGGHLLHVDRDTDPPTEAAVAKLVRSVLSDSSER